MASVQVVYFIRSNGKLTDAGPHLRSHDGSQKHQWNSFWKAPQLKLTIERVAAAAWVWGGMCSCSVIGVSTFTSFEHQL
jgi:hypothetical protein